MKNFLHSGKLGDIIWSLPFIKKIGGGNLYLNPLKLDEHVKECMMSIKNAESIISLLKKQSYLNEVKIWDKEEIDYNLDLYREVIFKIPNTTIAASYFHKFEVSGYEEETNKKWLEIDDVIYTNKIIVSRTPRYLVHQKNDFYANIDYKNSLFVGLEEEHKLFEYTFKERIEYFHTKDILELARVIAGGKYFVGNESLANAINESMKLKGFLELKADYKGFCMFERENLSYF